MGNNEEVKKENKETYIECPKCERRVKEGEKVCPYCQYDLVNKPKIEREINYKKWWLGGLIAIVIVIIVVIYLSFNNTSKPTAESGNSSTNAILKETKEENPYEIVNNYDGIYSFLLLDKNGSGVSFDSVGAIEINNGNCNIKYKILTKDTENKSNECIREYTGFAGKNREDNSEFYITLQKGKTRKDDIIYKCKLLDNKLLCELTSEFNLSGCYEKKLELIKINDTSSIDFIYNQKLEEEKVRRKEEDNRKAEEEKQAFIASCQSYTFEQIARNPDNFKGTNVKVTGEVIQVMVCHSCVF